METREFSILTKITGTKEQWDKIDRFVRIVKEYEAIDTENELICVFIDTRDICEGYLHECFDLSIMTRTTSSYANELYIKIMEEFGEPITWSTIADETSSVILPLYSV